jgi:type VI secretion system secreted protein VgrG
MTLTAGVYCFSSSAFLSGTLKLDAQGNPDAIFIFQTTNALTTGMGASVVFVNGGQAGNVLWAVGTSANIGASTSFAGDILAMGSITMNTGSSLQCGSALSINGQVSLDTNNISTCGTLATGFADTIDAPEPSTASLLLLVGLPGLLWLHRRKRRRAQSES